MSCRGSCEMFDESSQCTIVMPEECLGYGLVVPFLVAKFGLWVRIMNSLNSLLQYYPRSLRRGPRATRGAKLARLSE